MNNHAESVGGVLFALIGHKGMAVNQMIQYIQLMKCQFSMGFS